MLEQLNTWPEAVLKRFNSGSTVSPRSRFGQSTVVKNLPFERFDGISRVSTYVWVILSVSKGARAMNDEGRCYRGVETGN